MVAFEPEQTTALNDITAAILKGAKHKQRMAFLYGLAVGSWGSCVVLTILRWLQS